MLLGQSLFRSVLSLPHLTSSAGQRKIWSILSRAAAALVSVGRPLRAPPVVCTAKQGFPLLGRLSSYKVCQLGEPAWPAAGWGQGGAGRGRQVRVADMHLHPSICRSVRGRPRVPACRWRGAQQQGLQVPPQRLTPRRPQDRDPRKGQGPPSGCPSRRPGCGWGSRTALEPGGAWDAGKAESEPGALLAQGHLSQ